jgi:hypothetical protein
VVSSSRFRIAAEYSLGPSFQPTGTAFDLLKFINNLNADTIKLTPEGPVANGSLADNPTRSVPLCACAPRPASIGWQFNGCHHEAPLSIPG